MLIPKMHLTVFSPFHPKPTPSAKTPCISILPTTSPRQKFVPLVVPPSWPQQEHGTLEIGRVGATWRRCRCTAKSLAFKRWGWSLASKILRVWAFARRVIAIKSGITILGIAMIFWPSIVQLVMPRLQLSLPIQLVKLPRRQLPQQLLTWGPMATLMPKVHPMDSSSSQGKPTHWAWTLFFWILPQILLR